MKTKKSKTRFVLKKGFALLLSLCLAVSAMAAVGSISASAETDTIEKRGLAVVSPSDSFFSNDATAYKTALEHLGISTTKYVNTAQTKAAVVSAINSAFSGSDDNDINYLLLEGHGNVPIINLHPIFNYSEIREILDAIPGHFVVMIMACYSGSAIDTNATRAVSSVSDTNTAQSIMDSFLFSTNSEVAASSGEVAASSGVLADSAKYTVFCSSLSSEVSWAYRDNYSIAMLAWANALGYNPSSGNYTQWNDTNNDNVLVPSEIHNYAYNYTQNLHDDQHMCYYSMYPFESVFYQDYPLGDVTMDNCINDDDVLKIRKHIAKQFDLTPREKQLADVNFDSKVNMLDVLNIRKFL